MKNRTFLAMSLILLSSGSIYILADQPPQYDSAAVEYAQTSAGQDVGMVAHWKLDETSGTTAYDSSGNNNHGTIWGNPQWVPGFIGGALQFDGIDDYVDCGNNASLNITDYITLAVWVKANDIGNGEDKDWITKGNRNYTIKCKGDGRIEFFIHDWDWIVADFPGGDSFNGQWHHFAGTYDGRELTLYIDGQRKATTAHTGNISTSMTYHVNIARNSELRTHYYKGLLDDARIYNRALSAAEIMELVGPAKLNQLPDITTNGIDICVDSSDGTIRHLADDFQCTSSGKVTQITLWGSWKDDIVGWFKKIHVEIHPDDPVGTSGSDRSNLYSKPGPEVIWSKDFGPDQFIAKPYQQVSSSGEWWYDPATNQWKAGCAFQIWQIDMPVEPNQAFQQTGTQSQPVIYWLHVQVDTEAGRFGWKTRQWPEHFMDDAVWDIGSLPRLWKELRYPQPHPYEPNSIDLSFMLVCEAVAEQPTSQPIALTICPAVDTTCPAAVTQCPPVQTECPAVDTECPPLDTRCSGVETQCQGVQTQCPAVSTQCPPVNTQCPPRTTRCPLRNTYCPYVETECHQYFPTWCGSFTQCPDVTMCPQEETKCQITQCPSHSTWCPPSDTQCPVVDTKCPPFQSTTCPRSDTQCPPSDTKCPPVQTQCPYQSTTCPQYDTWCPRYDYTRCPRVVTICQETGCPPAWTKCPPWRDTHCPSVDTQCPPEGTKCPLADTQCPAEDTSCPETTTICPPQETQCPEDPTRCPPESTRCPPVATTCRIIETCRPILTLCICEISDSSAGVRRYLAATSCPAIKVLCPTIVPEQLLSKAD